MLVIGVHAKKLHSLKPPILYTDFCWIPPYSEHLSAKQAQYAAILLQICSLQPTA